MLFENTEIKKMTKLSTGSLVNYIDILISTLTDFTKLKKMKYLQLNFTNWVIKQFQK